MGSRSLAAPLSGGERGGGGEGEGEGEGRTAEGGGRGGGGGDKGGVCSTDGWADDGGVAAQPARRGFAPAPSLDYRCRGGLALAIKLNASCSLCLISCLTSMASVIDVPNPWLRSRSLNLVPISATSLTTL